MKKNMGSIDRFIRLFLAVVMMSLVLTQTVVGTWGWLLLVLAAVFLLTSLVSRCPLYLPFGISTMKKPN